MLQNIKDLKTALFKRINATKPTIIYKNLSTYKAYLAWLFISFLIACCITSTPYIQWLLYDLESSAIYRIIISFSALCSIAAIMFVPVGRRFSVGFFVGILWFGWIGFGLRLFDLGFLIPIALILSGLFMGIIFYLTLWCECFFLRFAFIMLFSYFKPLGFDWFIFESFFAYSYFHIDKLHFAMIIIGIYCIFAFKNIWVKIIGAILLIFSLDSSLFKTQEPQLAPFEVNMLSSDVKMPTGQKEISELIVNNLQRLESSAKSNAILILPEGSMPYPINLDSELIAYLNNLSLEKNTVIIIGGAMKIEEQKFFNTSYIFSNGSYVSIDKTKLVPFGEELPSFLQDIVGLFMQGVGGFSRGDGLKSFKIQGVDFSHAICYEATSENLYKSSPKYVIAVSNNVWFVPSIEPILQRNIIKYYSRLYNSTIYHAINAHKSYIITPQKDF